jgi:hypothetical protein
MISMRANFQNHIYDNEFQDKFENGGLPQQVDIPRWCVLVRVLAVPHGRQLDRLLR